RAQGRHRRRSRRHGGRRPSPRPDGLRVRQGHVRLDPLRDPLGAGSARMTDASAEPALEGSMSKQFYVVHTYSGYENRVKQAIEERARQQGLSEYFGEILIPTEQVVEVVKGERRTSKRKFFPGYIIVEMEMTPKAWHLVRTTPRVSGFVGGRPPDEIPAVSRGGVERLTSPHGEGAPQPAPKVPFASSTDPSRASTARWRKSAPRRADSGCSFRSSAGPRLSNSTSCRSRRSSDCGRPGRSGRHDHGVAQWQRRSWGRSSSRSP